MVIKWDIPRVLAPMEAKEGEETVVLADVLVRQVFGLNIEAGERQVLHVAKLLLRVIDHRFRYVRACKHALRAMRRVPRESSLSLSVLLPITSDPGCNFGRINLLVTSPGPHPTSMNLPFVFVISFSNSSRMSIASWYWSELPFTYSSTMYIFDLVSSAYAGSLSRRDRVCNRFRLLSNVLRRSVGSHRRLPEIVFEEERGNRAYRVSSTPNRLGVPSVLALVTDSLQFGIYIRRLVQETFHASTWIPPPYLRVSFFSSHFVTFSSPFFPRRRLLLRIQHNI